MLNFFYLFFRRFGTKCGGCSQGISPNDLVRRARSKVFHLKCFTCMVCRKQLSTGEELYVLDENKFICKEDYLNSKYNGKYSKNITLVSVWQICPCCRSIDFLSFSSLFANSWILKSSYRNTKWMLSNAMVSKSLTT